MFAKRRLKPWWVIVVGQGLDVHLVQCSAAQAETTRRIKAWSYQAPAHLRAAGVSDFPTPCGCLNHVGFVRLERCVCECPKCWQAVTA